MESSSYDARDRQDPNAVELNRQELDAITHADSRYQPWAGGALLFLEVYESIIEGHPDCENARRFSSWLAGHHGYIDWDWFTWDNEISTEIKKGRVTDAQQTLLGNLRNVAMGRLNRSYFLTLFPACSRPSPSAPRPSRPSESATPSSLRSPILSTPS